MDWKRQIVFNLQGIFNCINLSVTKLFKTDFYERRAFFLA
jgi:hypothetical protein